MGCVSFMFLVFDPLSLFLNRFKLGVVFFCYLFFVSFIFPVLKRKFASVFRSICYNLGSYLSFLNRENQRLSDDTLRFGAFMIYGPGVNGFTVNSCTFG